MDEIFSTKSVPGMLTPVQTSVCQLFLQSPARARRKALKEARRISRIVSVVGQVWESEIFATTGESRCLVLTILFYVTFRHF